jgi:hypothetical protein
MLVSDEQAVSRVIQIDQLMPRNPKEVPSVSGSRNGGQGNPYAFPLPSPRPLAASDPAKVVSRSYAGIRQNGPRTLGGSAADGEATEATATGKASRV